MFRLFVNEFGIERDVMNCITPVDTLAEAEVVALLDCRRIFKNPKLYLVYDDELEYKVMDSVVIIAKVRIVSIGETVTNSVDKR